jgi:hypothetical protein
MLRIEQSKFYKMVEASYICMKQLEEGKWKYKEKRKMACMKFLTADDEAQGEGWEPESEILTTRIWVLAHNLIWTAHHGEADLCLEHLLSFCSLFLNNLVNKA